MELKKTTSNGTEYKNYKFEAGDKVKALFGKPNTRQTVRMMYPSYSIKVEDPSGDDPEGIYVQLTKTQYDMLSEYEDFEGETIEAYGYKSRNQKPCVGLKIVGFKKKDSNSNGNKGSLSIVKPLSETEKQVAGSIAGWLRDGNDEETIVETIVQHLDITEKEAKEFFNKHR